MYMYNKEVKDTSNIYLSSFYDREDTGYPHKPSHRVSK